MLVLVCWCWCVGQGLVSSSEVIRWRLRPVTFGSLHIHIHIHTLSSGNSCPTMAISRVRYSRPNARMESPSSRLYRELTLAPVKP